MYITNEQRKELLAIKSEHITKDLLLRLFSGLGENKIKFDPTDRFVIRKGELRNVYEDMIETTVGRFIFNLFIVDDCFEGKIPYYNKSLNGPGYANFEKMVTNLLLKGEISPRQHMSKYITKRTFLEFTLVDILVPGMSSKVMILPPEIKKLKADLLKKHAKELSEGNIVVAGEIEKELVAKTKEFFKNDPSMRMYDLNKPSIGNNYKNMVIMVGPILDNSTGKFNISEDDYLTGINKEKFGNFGDMAVFGSYSRSVDTQYGGAEVKKFMSALQSIQIDEDPNSDCGTPYTIKVNLTNDNIEDHMYSYIKEEGKLIMIEPDNSSLYINKLVNMRTPLYCNNDKPCSKCAGQLYYKLGITNVGLGSAKIPSVVMQKSMKAMHDLTVKNSTMNIGNSFTD